MTASGKAKRDESAHARTSTESQPVSVDPSKPPARPEVSQAALERLLDLSTRLPFERDLQDVVRLVLDGFESLFPGYAVGACIADPHGEQIVELRLPEDHGPDLGRDPTRLFATLSHERVLPLDDGHGSTFHVAGEDPSLDDDGADVVQLVERCARVLASAVRNVTAFGQRGGSTEEVRRMKAQLIQAEKLSSLGEIVAGVVHELNNPLTSIVAYSDYLRKKSEKENADGDDVERLRRISDAAERILKFTRDLIDYARPSKDVPAPIPVHEIINKALVFCEHEFSDSRVLVHRTFLENAPLVRGIPGQLTQVFVNLFTNASHAMAERGGSLWIQTTLEPSRDMVVVDITDTGVGIERAVLDRIFEPFFTTKPEGQGTGLGLSIVRDIVVAHGGEIRAESTPGEGTSFRVNLPVAAHPPSSRPRPGSERPAALDDGD